MRAMENNTSYMHITIRNIISSLKEFDNYACESGNENDIMFGTSNYVCVYIYPIPSLFMWVRFDFISFIPTQEIFQLIFKRLKLSDYVK